MKKLFYHAERTDARGNIIAPRGFLRIQNGREVIGRSIDWFVEGESAAMDLIGKRLLQDRLASADGAAASPQRANASAPATDAIGSTLDTAEDTQSLRRIRERYDTVDRHRSGVARHRCQADARRHVDLGDG